MAIEPMPVADPTDPPSTDPATLIEPMPPWPLTLPPRIEPPTDTDPIRPTPAWPTLKAAWSMSPFTTSMPTLPRTVLTRSGAQVEVPNSPSD